MEPTEVADSLSGSDETSSPLYTEVFNGENQFGEEINENENSVPDTRSSSCVKGEIQHIEDLYSTVNKVKKVKTVEDKKE